MQQCFLSGIYLDARKLKESNHVWQWSKPPSWMNDRQRKYASLSKQNLSCAVICACWRQKSVKTLALFFFVVFFCQLGSRSVPLPRQPLPRQPLCDRPPCNHDQRAQSVGRVLIIQRVFSATRALCEASLWATPNAFPVSCRLKLTKEDVASLPFGRLIQT